MTKRRAAIRSMIGGSLLLPGILSELLAAESADPLSPKKPHHPPKAKRVIFLFSTGGVSQMDTFDPKPKLFSADGKTLGAGGGLSLEKRPLPRPRWDFKPGGTCGTMVSDLFPHLRERMDDVCLIRSMTTDNNEHFQATLAIHTGSFFVARPSLGSWISFGLGTLNQNLPSFVVIAPHLQNFFDTIRGKATLNCPAEEAFQTAVSVLRVNEAIESRAPLAFTSADFRI